MLQAIFIAITISSLFLALPVVATCPTGWTTDGVSCYMFNLKSSEGFEECRSRCTALGASTLCITNATNNAWAHSQTLYPTWIGYTDLPHRLGQYTWSKSTGCNSTYTNWNTGEPSRDGNVAIFAIQWTHGKWNNPSDTNPQGCACQIIDGAGAAVSE